MVLSYWPPDTYVLTGRGFIKIFDIVPYDLVAVTDGFSTWFESPATLARASSRRISDKLVRKTACEQLFGCFPGENRILMGVGIGESRYQPLFIEVGKATSSQLSRIYNSFDLKFGSESILSPIHRFMVATQADGSVRCRDSDGKYVVTFSFAKDRKADRLERICWELEKFGAEYTMDTTDVFRFRVVCPFECHKRFRQWVNLSNKSKAWLGGFLKEVQEWDSHIIDNHAFSFSTNCTDDLDIVQAAAVLCGYRTRVSLQKTSGVYSLLCRSNGQFNGMGLLNSGAKFSHEEWAAIITSTPYAGIIFRSNHIVFAGM